jgi:hypothetical protein
LRYNLIDGMIVRSWIGIAIAGAVLSASACGDDGPRPDSEAAPTERELAARWRGVEINSKEERISAGSGEDSTRSLLRYPVVVGAPTPEIRDRLQAALSVDSALDLPMDWYRKEFSEGKAPTVDVSYRITYKRDYLLDVRYRVEALGGGGPARYGWRHRVFDLRTGTRLRAAQAFRPDALAELATRVHERIYQETDTDGAPEVYTDASAAPKRFGVGDLDNFAIDDQGVTFSLEFSFPHVFSDAPVDAAFTWDELKPYIRRDGPLAMFR